MMMVNVMIIVIVVVVNRGILQVRRTRSCRCLVVTSWTSWKSRGTWDWDWWRRWLAPTSLSRLMPIGRIPSLSQPDFQPCDQNVWGDGCHSRSVVDSFKLMLDFIEHLEEKLSSAHNLNTTVERLTLLVSHMTSLRPVLHSQEGLAVYFLVSTLTVTQQHWVYFNSWSLLPLSYLKTSSVSNHGNSRSTQKSL